MTTANRTDEKRLKNVKYSGTIFPQRNNVLPSVTQKEKHIKKRNASLNFCLCTADIKDPQKEGWTPELYLSSRDREENTPSFLAVLRATL